MEKNNGTKTQKTSVINEINVPKTPSKLCLKTALVAPINAEISIFNNALLKI